MGKTTDYFGYFMSILVSSLCFGMKKISEHLSRFMFLSGFRFCYGKNNYTSKYVYESGLCFGMGKKKWLV